MYERWNKLALILGIRYAISVLSVIPNIKQRQTPLFRIFIATQFSNIHTVAHYLGPYHVPVGKHGTSRSNSRYICQLKTTTILQTSLNTMREGKHASSLIGSVGNKRYFAQQVDVRIHWSNFGKSVLNLHLDLHLVSFTLLLSENGQLFYLVPLIT
jgi:hypothetical protein